MTSIHGILFEEIDIFWKNVRYFFRNNKTVFEIMFLLIYFIEQVILFLSILLYPKYVTHISGLFALIVISTISFEKICMESRYTWLKEKYQEQEMEKYRLKLAQEQYLEEIEKMQERMNKVTQSLNISKRGK